MNRNAKKVTVVGALCILLGSIFLFKVLKSDQPISGSGQQFDSKQLITSDSHKITAPNAKVTIVEFLDYEGEFSSTNHVVLKKVLQEYKGKVNYVVRHFPTHENSVPAAKAAEAAGEQGKYWEMHDKLFEKYAEWAEEEGPKTDLFIKYAESLGLDIGKFKASLDSEKYKDVIESDLSEMKKLGIKVPSAYFIGGKQITGAVTYENWRGEIDKLM